MKFVRKQLNKEVFLGNIEEVSEIMFTTTMLIISNMAVYIFR